MATPIAIPLAEMGVDEVERAKALARRYRAEFGRPEELQYPA